MGAFLNTLAKDVLRGVGLEVRRLKYVNSEETVLPAILTATRPAAVLDVGANTGQFATLLRKSGYRGRIVSFEAIPAVHAALSAASARDPMWTVAPCAALGRERGQAEIHIAGNSASSSILPMSEMHLAAAPESAYVGRQSVQLRRLDDLVPQLLPEGGGLYLKIDTQGYEREVLEGSTALLPDVMAMQVETSLVPLYNGAPSFTEMIAFIQSMGFEIFSLVPGLRNVRDGRLLQMDAFFVRGSISRHDP
jgi:FkbM family methyltransferase